MRGNAAARRGLLLVLGFATATVSPVPRAVAGEDLPLPERARAAWSEARLDEARRLLEIHLRERPDDVGARADAAELAEILGDLPATVDHRTRLLRVGGDVRAALDLAYLHRVRTGDDDRARAALAEGRRRAEALPAGRAREGLLAAFDAEEEALESDARRRADLRALLRRQDRLLLAALAAWCAAAAALWVRFGIRTEP